jgi:hypothetical protein
MFTRAFNWWSNRLKTHPYSSNMIFGASVTAFGDYLAQNVEKTNLATTILPDQHKQQEIEKQNELQNKKVSYRTSEYNYRRTGIYASLAFMVTPLWLTVLKITDKLVGANQPHSGAAKKAAEEAAKAKVVLTKRQLKLRAIRQGMMTTSLGWLMLPLTITYLTTTFSIFVHGVYDYEVIRDRILERLERNAATHIMGSLAFWSTLGWLPMFYYLPAEWRLVYGVSLNIFWQMCVSFLQHRPPA